MILSYDNHDVNVRRNANISDMVSKSRGDYAFALFDLDHKLEEEELEKVKKVPGVIRVNVIEK